MGSVVSKAKDIQHKILNKPYVEYLCDDVWVKIFVFLNVKQFCTMSVICTYFRNITHYTRHNIQHYWKCSCMKQFPSIFVKLRLQDASLNHWHKLFAEMKRLTNMLEKQQKYQQYPFYIQLCISDSINSIKLIDSHPDSTYSSQTQHGMSKFERTYQDEFCETALQFAVSHHSCNIVKYYLDDPALKLSWKECGVLMQTCLNQPCTWNESDISCTMSTFKMILNRPNCNQQSINYASVNQFYNLSSLMLACHHGHYQAVPILLQHGAIVCKHDTRTTPLCVAITCLELHHYPLTSRQKSRDEQELLLDEYRQRCINIISMWTHIINHKDFNLNKDVSQGCIPPLFQMTALKKRSYSTVAKKDWRLVFAKYEQNPITFSLLTYAIYKENFWMIKIISQFLIEIYNKGLVTKEYISEFVNFRNEVGLSAYHYWCFPKPKKSTLYVITEIPQLDFSIRIGDSKCGFRIYDTGMLGSDLYIKYQSDDDCRCMKKLLQWESKGIVKFLPERK